MITVLVSANTEWSALKDLLPDMSVSQSPFGEWGEMRFDSEALTESIVFLHGGWGKIRAAASTEFAIDRFSPSLVINLGTCGGFAGQVDVGQILLVEKTIVYDIHERMLDPALAIDEYSTTLDLSWVGELPPNVKRALMVSGDGDLDPAGIGALRRKYGAIAGDWESGAIAYVCYSHGIPCLILRGVSDLVSEELGEAYGEPEIFRVRTRRIMSALVHDLPIWIEKFKGTHVAGRMQATGTNPT